MPRLIHLYNRFTKAMTLGVRALVLDRDRVFLVKHSYTRGWYLPGGGVEKGETLQTALARELGEEGNIELTAAPALFGIYLNSRISQRDHVALFVARSFRQPAPPVPNHEIVAHGFFPIDALPGDATPATRARVAEVLFNAPVSEHW